MKTTYKNSFYNKSEKYSQPEFENENPTEYKGYLIFEHIHGSVFHVVKDGVCIHMLAGINGAKRKIDEITEPVNAWGCKINTQQLRMDKAARRYGAKIRRGVNTVRYL